jgi:photosystem II stability/assembly factor-like uncharacterized protein
MAQRWLKKVLLVIVAGSVIAGFLLLPWSGKAEINTSGKVDQERSVTLSPTGTPSPVAANTYIPVVRQLSFQDTVVLISDKPAFDKCNPPSKEHMQVWWDESPYWSVNIYMGGISLACTPSRLTPAWMYAVARQGWTFIPTWVGLQAPCSRYKYKMDPDPAKSYLQGKAEADQAAAAARDLSLMGDQVIYADIESYYGASAECRAAVAAFLQGWVDGLHARQAKAGVYGAPCTSYLTDWALLTPPPDYVWIAHWNRQYYDPLATVWDAPCLPNSLWANHQRIKQYTGPHIETWGELSATLDSNILDGAINAHAGLLAALPGAETAPAARLRQARLLTPTQGWALAGDRLLWTDDAGVSWREITPAGLAPGTILAVTFLDPQRGWLVTQRGADEAGDSLMVLATADGGLSWQSFPLRVRTEPGGAPLAQAFLDFVDSGTGWLALRLQSGSSFSLGRLFATGDGGRTWEERSLPLGEPVKFVDDRRGWTAGGPSGEQLFYTDDGGRTWSAQAAPLPLETAGGAYYGLPAYRPGQPVILPVTLAGPRPQLALFTAGSPGQNWRLAQLVDLPGAGQPGGALPFSLNQDGRWWAAWPGAGHLSTASSAKIGNVSQVNTDLPPGVIALDFANQESGWAIVQDGNCVGQKSSAGGGAWQCTSQTRLMRSADGGRSWQEITPRP